MTMFGWLFRKWRKRQRAIDLQLLWPVCKRHADDLHHAKAAFMMHAAHDTAWTKDYSHEELVAFVDELR